MSRRTGVVTLAAALALAASAACTPPAPPRMVPLTREAYAHYLRGRTAFFEGDYQRAVDELDQAQIAAPDQAGVVVARAEALLRLGKTAAARTAIATARERWPGSIEVWLAAGAIERASRDLTAAAAAYRRAIALDRTGIDGYLGLATTELQARRPAEAERVYRALVKARPDAAEGHFQLAEILVARDDDAAAATHLRTVVGLDGDRLDARRALAGILVRAGKLDDAIAELRLAFDRSGYDPAIANDLVWLLIERGDRRGALDVLGLYDRGVAPEVQADAAGLLFAIGEPERALAVARVAACRGHDPVLVRARALLARGDAGAAAAVLAAVPSSHEAWPGAQALAAELAMAVDRLDDARALLDAARARAPEHVGVLAVDAERLRRAGDVAAARQRFAAAARARPHDATLMMAWSSFESRAGQRARALALAETVLAATPRDPAAQNLVGYTLVELGRDLPRARRLLARARGGAPGDPGVLDSWGWLLRAEGDLAGADRALTRAARSAPHDAEVLVHAARVAEARGRRARAERLLLAARVQPMSPELARTVDAHLIPLRGSSAPAPPPACYAAADMRTSAFLRLALGPMLALSACKSTPSSSQCEKLLAHLIEMETVTAGAATAPEELKGDKAKDMKAETEKQKKAISDYAIGQKFMETCTQKTPTKVVECGLEAKNPEELAKCDAPET